MTLDPRLERNLPAVLAALGAGPAPEYTDTLLERISHVRQRPAWFFREWWLPAALKPGQDRFRPLPLRLLVVIALLALALVMAGILAGVGHRRGLPAPFGPAGNGAIVYGIGGDIYAGDSMTGASQKIVSGPTYDFRPGYSPDGSTVGFLRRVDAAKAGLTNIVVVPAEGGQPRVVTTVPLAAEPGWWSWVPDSRSIVVMMSASRDSTYELFDTSQASPARVITPAIAIDPNMAFQPPAGERFAVRGYVGSQVGLYTMGLDGSNVTPVVKPYTSLNEQIDLVYPAWSPDGTRIVIQRATTDGSTTALYVMNADGSGGHQIDATAGASAAGWAVWSQDGTRIAYQSSNGVRDANGYFIYSWAVLRVADGTITMTGPSLAYDTVATWSPDGKEILILNLVQGHPGLILDPEGGPGRTVTWSAVGGDWERIAP